MAYWPYKVVMANGNQFLIYTSVRYVAILSFTWSRVSGNMTNVSPTFTLLLARFLFSTHSQPPAWPKVVGRKTTTIRGTMRITAVR